MTTIGNLFGAKAAANASQSAAPKRDRAREFANLMDRAGMHMRPAEAAIGIAVATAILWVFSIFFMHPVPVMAVMFLVLCGGASAGGFWCFVQMKIKRRLDQFVQQLELALRLISSGVRIGLGLRQALTMVIEEMPNPAKYEYMRVIGQTNIGVSVYDALDTLSKRMPCNETLMMARAIRIQSQTGGDLGKILEHLANTIKDRRRIQRKIRALTSEGRASAAILAALPPFLSGFISLTEPQMGTALFLTAPGHVALAIVAVLEALGVFTLMKMLKVDV